MPKALRYTASAMAMTLVLVAAAGAHRSSHPGRCHGGPIRTQDAAAIVYESRATQTLYGCLNPHGRSHYIGTAPASEDAGLAGYVDVLRLAGALVAWTYIEPPDRSGEVHPPTATVNTLNLRTGAPFARQMPTINSGDYIALAIDAVGRVAWIEATPQGAHRVQAFSGHRRLTLDATADPKSTFLVIRRDRVQWTSRTGRRSRAVKPAS